MLTALCQEITTKRDVPNDYRPPSGAAPVYEVALAAARERG